MRLEAEFEVVTVFADGFAGEIIIGQVVARVAGALVGLGAGAIDAFHLADRFAVEAVLVEVVAVVAGAVIGR